MKTKFQRTLTCFVLVLAMVITPFTVSARSIDGSINDDAIVTHKDVQITETLTEAIRTADADDLIDVYIWMPDINHEAIETEVMSRFFNANSTLENASSDTVQTYIETYRGELKTAYVAANATKMANLETVCGSFDKTFVSSYAPMAIVSLTKAQIAKAATSKDNVEILDLFVNVEGELESNIANSNSGATVVRDSLGYTGSGVKLGMIEHGHPLALTEYNDLFNTSKIHLATSFSAVDEDAHLHATRVAAIMVGKGTTYNGVTYKGIAPNAELYCAQALDSLQFYSGVETLIEYGVNAINMSMGFGIQTRYNTMNLWVDHIAYVHDVHIVKSSGNYNPEDDNDNDYEEHSPYVSAPGLSYNIVTVGAYTDNNNTLNYQGPSTTNLQTLNLSQFSIADYSRYDENTPAPSKPDLVASGTHIHYADIPNVKDGYYIDSGTSFAAPQVTAVMAQLMQAKTTLKVKQDQMKAILCSSAIYRLSGDSLEESGVGAGNAQYNKQGAGVLNAWLASYIATSGKSDSIYMYGNTATVYTHYMTATSSDIYLRFALTWLKSSTSCTAPSGTSNSNPSDLANYNVTITTPTGDVVTSSSVNGNLEVIQLNTGDYGYGTYTVKIQINTANNVTNYLGFAWY